MKEMIVQWERGKGWWPKILSSQLPAPDDKDGCTVGEGEWMVAQKA